MGKNESILVVDDIQEQRELASTILGILNYRVYHSRQRRRSR